MIQVDKHVFLFWFLFTIAGSGLIWYETGQPLLGPGIALLLLGAGARRI